MLPLTTWTNKPAYTPTLQFNDNTWTDQPNYYNPDGVLYNKVFKVEKRGAFYKRHIKDGVLDYDVFLQEITDEANN